MSPHIFDYLSQQSVLKRSKIEYLIRFEIGERDWRTRLQNEIAERPIVNPNAIGCTNPLHTIKFIPDSDMLFPYSYQNSIP